jgi:hypothetical protein
MGKMGLVLNEIVNPLKKIYQKINAGESRQGQAEDASEGAQNVAVEQAH